MGGPFCCVCTSCNRFESAPMTALQSSSVVLIRWLQSFSSQQHNAAEQASTAHSQKRFPLSRTRRPLSLSFPEKMRCCCWRRHYGKLLFRSVKDWLWEFFPPFFKEKVNVRTEYIFRSKCMHQKFAAVSVEGFLFNIHSLCECPHCFLLASALK